MLQGVGNKLFRNESYITKKFNISRFKTAFIGMSKTAQTRVDGGRLIIYTWGALHWGVEREYTLEHFKHFPFLGTKQKKKKKKKLIAGL